MIGNLANANDLCRESGLSETLQEGASAN